MTVANHQQQALAIFAGGGNPFTASAKDAGVTDGVFGRFNGNTGDFIVGDGTLEPGTPCAFAFLDAKQVWLGFDEDNKPHRGPEVLFLNGQVLPEPEKILGVRWNKQIVVPLITMDGDQILYSSKADKPTRPIWRLIKQFGELMGRNRSEDGKFKVPVIELNSRPFEMTIEELQNDGSKRKIKVTKYAEDFKIVSWMDEDELTELVVGAAAEEAPETVINHVEEAEIILPTKVASTPAPAVSGARRPRPGQAR